MKLNLIAPLVNKDYSKSMRDPKSYQNQEKICLLGRLEVKCGSVIQVEGLRSSKAVVFINRKSNMRLDAKTYSVLRMSLQKKPAFFAKNFKFRVETRLDVPLMKKPGDKKWKK